MATAEILFTRVILPHDPARFCQPRACPTPSQPCCLCTRDFPRSSTPGNHAPRPNVAMLSTNSSSDVFCPGHILHEPSSQLHSGSRSAPSHPPPPPSPAGLLQRAPQTRGGTLDAQGINANDLLANAYAAAPSSLSSATPQLIRCEIQPRFKFRGDDRQEHPWVAKNGVEILQAIRQDGTATTAPPFRSFPT